MRTWPADILTIDGQIQKTFHILIPRWRLTNETPTLSLNCKTLKHQNNLYATDALTRPYERAESGRKRSSAEGVGCSEPIVRRLARRGCQSSASRHLATRVACGTSVHQLGQLPSQHATDADAMSRRDRRQPDRKKRRVLHDIMQHAAAHEQR